MNRNQRQPGFLHHAIRTWHTDAHRQSFHRYNDALIFKDTLALDRTAAANKRTLYAFMRTALDFNVSGLVFIRFFNNDWIMAIGGIFIVISILLGGYGWARYHMVKQHYIQLNKACSAFKDHG